MELHFTQTESVVGTVYHATTENVNYLGAASTAEIARQVFDSHGPSGPNSEYLLQLEQALLELGAEDTHISELANALRQLHLSL